MPKTYVITIIINYTIIASLLIFYTIKSNIMTLYYSESVQSSLLAMMYFSKHGHLPRVAVLDLSLSRFM